MKPPLRLLLAVIAFTLAMLAPCARAQVVSPAPAPLALVSDDSKWQVIPQHPLEPSKPPAADDPRWMPLGEYRSRAYQLSNPRELGLALWIQTTVNVATPPPAGESVVVAMANALIADAAFLNGEEMREETLASNRPFPHEDQVLFPGNKSAEAGLFAKVGDSKNSFWTNLALISRDGFGIRRPMSAIFSGAATAVKTGKNILQLAIYEQSVNTMLPGPLELRAARLDDRVQLNSFTRSVGDNATETVLLIQQALTSKQPATLTLEMQDDVGRVLWTDTPQIDFAQGTFQKALPITPRSLQDYKAVVRVTAPGQPVVDHWAYTHQAHLKPSALRDEFKLTTTAWEYRALNGDEEVVIPPPSDGWKQGKAHNGASDGFKRRHYFRTRFTAPQELANGRAMLAIGELRFKADFYLNGENLGTRRYHECPFELDVTAALKPGQENELVVVMYDGMTPEFLTDGTPPIPDGQKEPPALTSRFHFASLHEIRLNHISLRRIPAVRVEHNRIVTSVKERSLTVTSTLENTTAAPVTTTPTFAVKDRSGTVLNFTGKPVTIPAKGTVETTTRQPWPDAKLWSPDSPHLYALETALRSGSGFVDATRERFGFREITIDGKNFLLNGEIIRFRTLAPSILLRKGHNQGEPDFYKYNTNIESLRRSREVGFNAFRIRDANYIRAYYAACDELGLATGILSDLVDNHSRRIAFTDPVTWENSYKELVSFHKALGNHASALWYDLGNENISHSAGPSSDPKVADFVYENERKIRAYDPTRFVFSSGAEGGYDGRAQVYSPHYPGFSSQSGNLAPTQWWFWPVKYTDIPASLRSRALWPDPDPKGRYNGMVKFPGGAWANVPIFNDEYAWLQDWTFSGNIHGNGQPWAGERAFKPFAPRIETQLEQLGYPRYWLVSPGDQLTFLERIEMETQAYRAHGIAGLQRWDTEYRLPEGPHMPVVAFLRTDARGFFADSPVERTLYAVNDSEATLSMDLEVRVSRTIKDGARQPVQTEKLQQTLSRGEIFHRSFSIPAQEVDAPTEFHAEVVWKDGANERILHRQSWTLYPRTWPQPVQPKARVALYDPSVSVQGMFEALGVTPLSLTTLSEIKADTAPLLVIGENVPPDSLSSATEALRLYMESGGTVLMLRQPDERGIATGLSIKLEEGFPHWSHAGHRFGGSRVSLTAHHHPIFEGLLPDDFGYWAPYGLVFGTGYKVDKQMPNVRILAGLAPFSAQLLEGRVGKGRWLATTLELTPETVKVAPPAARLLANIVRWTNTQPLNPAPAKAVVYSPADSAVAKTLQSSLKLQATFTTQEPELADYQVLVLSSWTKETPAEAFANKVLPWLKKGGTLLVQQGGNELAAWLKTATGLTVTAEPAPARERISKVAVHPLLNSVFEGDLQWERRPTLKERANYAGLLLRVEGETPLLEPTALSVTSVGRGRLVIDQTLWNEAKESLRGSRFQSTLLANLDLAMKVPDRKIAPPLPPGVNAFSQIPFASAANLESSRSGIDLSKVPAMATIAGIPFRIPGATGSFIALQSAALPESIAAGYGKLPVESRPISLGRKTPHLFFAHTGFYHQALDGDTVLTYDVRYAGHEKVIGGQDVGDLIISVPVRAGTDLLDWNVPKGTRPPANGAVFPAAGGNDALITVQRWDNPFPDRVIESIVVRAAPTAKTQPIVLGITTAE